METNKYSYEKARERVKKIKGYYVHIAIFIVINSFILVNAYIRSTYVEESFWQWSTFTTLIIWGIGLGFHTYGVFGQQLLFSKEWEERKLKQFMEEDK
ncbi:2TM domain-containing protein [Flavobacteriaceae bacterium M23B6Z8]